MSELKIVWSKQAKEALKSIYDYYKDKSRQGASNVKSDLLSSPKTIVFAKQYQVDDINPHTERRFQSTLFYFLLSDFGGAGRDSKAYKIAQ
jgi:plasmid stabilization system protein ParE